MTKKFLGDSGQALFEFLAFLPLILILYSVTLTFANAINGSINQQKITRGYFYNLIHNDSYLPSTEVLKDLQQNAGVRTVGMFAIGWKLYAENQSEPVAPCYKIISLSAQTSDETCTPGNIEGDSTQFVRVKTSYGVCSATYHLQNNYFIQGTNTLGNAPVAGYGSCLNL